jgi:hypothetical protein
MFNRSAVVGFYWDEFLLPYDPAGVKREGKKRREGVRDFVYGRVREDGEKGGGVGSMRAPAIN